MRITQQMIMRNAVKYMDDNLKRLHNLQGKVASGKEFQRPSDNPSSMAYSMSLRSTLESNQAYLDTASLVDGWLTATDSALGEMIKVAGRGIELTRQGIPDTQGESQRAALAGELNILLRQAVDIGNTNHLGNYIFAGFQSTSAPFDFIYDASGTISGVNYGGDDGNMLRSLGASVTITQNILGEPTFEDLYNAMINARDALLSNNTLNVQNALSALEHALKTVNEANTTNGARQRQARVVQERLEKTQIELKSLLSQKEDINLAEAISLLRQQESIYQIVLEVGNRAISALSLFDMLS